VLALGLGAGLGALGALGAEQLSQAEALALAFPGSSLERREHFLTDEQLERARALAGVEVRARYVVVYEARRQGALEGVALFDTHVVRTQPETAMVAVSPAGVVLRVEVVQFREPQDYAAPERWRRQLAGQTLTPRLTLKADIKPLSGASLTAQALVDATRRALALFQVLYPQPAPPSAPGKADR
jgi:hypothetical protein